MTVEYTTRPDHQAFADGEAPGLTKREYFAAMALQGMLARGTYRPGGANAADAVREADLLIAALNETGTEGGK
jgi:hypothetical protein